MPTSNIDLYHMQDARNNFDAMRPAPVCPDAKQFMGQCQNIHISTNCYYGYHDPKSADTSHVTTDCEMQEAPPAGGSGVASASPHSNARKRSADDDELPQRKRIREEVQKERNSDPETTGKRFDSSAEDLLESLYWNIHGGHIFHLKCL